MPYNIRTLKVTKHLVLILGLLAALSSLHADSQAGTTRRLEKALAAPEGVIRNDQGAVGVWVRFDGRGLYGGDLAEALQNAEAELTPKAAERRAKMGGPLVVEDDLPLNRDYVKAVQDLGGSLRRESRWLNAASFDVDPAAIATIAALPFVTEVDVVARFTKADVPTSAEEKAAMEEALEESRSDKSTEWSLDYGGSVPGAELINLPRAHGMGLTGRGVTIGVIDTGYDLDWHQSMQHMDIVATWDFINGIEAVDDQPNWDDPNQSWHGTECLSVIGAYQPGEIVGSAWEASFILAKTEEIDREVELEEDNWIAALEWMEGLGVDVVSSGLGYYQWYEFSDLDGGSAPITLAADLAAARGVVMVISAGNTHEQTGLLPLLAPADGRKVITVGSADTNGWPTQTSSRGPTFDGRIKPDVLGCGWGILVSSWWAEWIYTQVQGSSYATAQVAGVAALMLENNPRLTPLQIREALRMTASHATHPDNAYGWGVVDAYRAVNYYGPTIEHDPILATDDYVSPLVIEAEITSPNVIDEGGVTVTWRASFQAWNRASMTRTTGDTFRAELPAPYPGAIIQYYIDAFDTSGNPVSHPLGAPENLHLFLAATDVTAPTLTHYYLSDQMAESWPPVVTAVADDANGLAGVELHYSVNGGAEQGPVPLTESRGEWQGTFPPLSVVPGDRITYRVVAVDGSSRANATESGPFTFDVITERERVLLIDDRFNFKSHGEDGVVNPHASGSDPAPADKAEADFETILTDLGYQVDVIATTGVTDGSTTGYDVVVVNSGGNWYPVLHEPMRAELIHYVARGGRVLSEGGETAFMGFSTDREYCEKVLGAKEYFGEGGFTLFRTHGNEGHPFSNRPHRMPHSIELESYGLNYNSSDLVEVVDDATVHFNSFYSAVTGGVVTRDDNTGLDGGQTVYFPINFTQLKPVMAEWLLENAMTWLTIREADGPSSVTGRVLRADATDHAGTLVTIDEHHQAVTGADGSYTITGLWGGTFTLTATREGYGPRTTTVALAEGETGMVDDMVVSPVLMVEGLSTTVLQIPDNNATGVVGAIAIAESGVLQSMTVTVDISHYSVNNLVIELISPAGTRVTLHNRSGGTADDLAGTWPTELTVDGPGDLPDFVDEEIGGDWQLGIRDLQFGATGRLNSWSISIQYTPASAAGGKDESAITTRIIGNTPNPFNPRTVIAFELAKAGSVQLDVFDMRGRLVRRLVDGEMGPGIHRVLWDGLDSRGRASASGIYFSKLRAGARTEVGKMLLVR